MNTPKRAHPGNAAVEDCQWYLGSDRGGPSAITVHLWGESVSATDSRSGEHWTVRHCVQCGVMDTESLRQQYNRKEENDKPNEEDIHS